MKLAKNFKKTNIPVGLFFSAGAVTALVFAVALWSVGTSTDLVNATVRLCHGVFSQCLGYVGLVHLTLFWAGGLTLLSGLIFAAFRAIITLIGSRRALKRLPLKNQGAELVFIKDSAMATAFTHGIFHPRVYISKGLMDSLTGAELRAVFFHELCHKKNRDPLRFFLLSILRDTFFFIPLAGHALRLLIDRQEKRADDSVVWHMSEPLSIAGALLKLLASTSVSPAETASILGHRGSVEERIRRLLGEKEGAKTKKGPGSGALLVSIIIPLFMLISLAMPLKQGLPMKISTCTTSHCSESKIKPDRDCRIHCDKKSLIGKPAPLKPLP